MSTTQVSSDDAGGAATVGTVVGTNLEVIVIPVSDVDRAKEVTARLPGRVDPVAMVREQAGEELPT